MSARSELESIKAELASIINELKDLQRGCAAIFKELEASIAHRLLKKPQTDTEKQKDI